ncbi:flagellar hook-associated, putative [Babesia ovis]|uniref:Flagellar hook-associated, putative n=1 Tax=Babesia ovis TaxID=5869 RepID=A0A9W5TAU6_BABOV|nr:flagellar hook-associated, putative [Babesia ovis]
MKGLVIGFVPALVVYNVFLGMVSAMDRDQSQGTSSQHAAASSGFRHRMYKIPSNQIKRIDEISDAIVVEMQTLNSHCTDVFRRLNDIQQEIRRLARLEVQNIDQIFVRIERLLRTTMLPPNTDTFSKTIPRHPDITIAEYKSQETMKSLIKPLYEIWIDCFVLVMDDEIYHQRIS